jgi:hypothetical protein
MSIDSRVTGIGSLTTAFAAWSKALDDTAKANVEQIAAMVIRDAMGNFDGAHTKGKPHVPNANNFPNIVTGTLRRSIQGSPLEKDGPGAYRTTVGPTAKYGRRVELGLAPTGAYPYFGPAVRKARQEMAGILAANIARYLK